MMGEFVMLQYIPTTVVHRIVKVYRTEKKTIKSNYYTLHVSHACWNRGVYYPFLPENVKVYFVA